MGIGRNGDSDTSLAGEPRVRVAQVQPVGLGVDLERGSRLRGPRDDALDVDVGSGPLQDPPAGQVSDAVDVRVVDRAQDALGRVALERGVHRRDDPVELREHLVGDVERAVGADVDLDSAQHPERLHALVDGFDLPPLRLHPPVAQVVRVIGQAEEPVAATLRLRRHLLDRVLAVGGPGRVAVHLAAEVGELDELRQLSARAAASSPSFSRSSGGMNA